MGADNAFAWQQVSMQEIHRDQTVEKMVVSKRLALKLVGGDAKKWTKVDQRVITDDEGTKHDCGHVINVSWRWDTQNSTRDSTVYISSKLHAQTGDQGNPAPQGVFDLLVPDRYDLADGEPSRPGLSACSPSTTSDSGYVPPFFHPDNCGVWRGR